MKIERISDNIIKVTISLNDLEERNIDLSTLNYNSPATQELFLDMMEQAELEFGFNISDSQLIIEPMSDADEGFIVTITRMDGDGDFESIQKYIKSKLSKKDLKSKKKTRKIYSTALIYAFDSFEDLCSLAQSIGGFYSGENTIYKCRDTYYIHITMNHPEQSDTGSFEAIVSEYGTKVSNIGFFEGYLNEYGTKIIEGNALEVLHSWL